MATTNQHAGDWDAADMPVVPTRMSEAQFEDWVLANRNVRAEWVEGEVQMMSPANFDHCEINLWLLRLLGDFVEAGGAGGVVGFDYMIRLRGGTLRRVPDVFYVAEQRKDLITRNYLDGPPDLAVEIVSSDSQSRDFREKYLEYEAAGVREYWIVDPFSRHIEAYCLSQGEQAGDASGGKFVRIDEQDGRLASTVLDGLYLRNEWLWATPRPKVRDVLKEMGIE